MNELIRFKRWTNKEKRWRGLICHFYLENKDFKYYGKVDYAYFNLVSISRDWVVKGTKGHGISNNNRTSQVPCLNCFEINEKFITALKDLEGIENSKFKIGVIFNKRKLKNYFKTVLDVSTKWPNPYPPPNKCHYYDKGWRRKGALAPFNNCDVVRIETKRNRQFTNIDGLDVIKGDAILALLVRQQEQINIEKLLKFKGLERVETFAVL